MLANAALSIEDMDLVCVFSNLLDNAIEACRADCETAAPFIDIAANTYRGYFIVSVTNSTASATEPNEKKQSPDNHGLGLHILMDVAEKYNGSFDIQRSEKQFCATITLSIA